MDQIKNGAYSTVATAPSPSSSGTSLVVAAGEGTNFPTVPFNAVVCPAGAQPKPSNMEIVRVTARSTDTLTITRTQEGTSARAIQVGDQIWAGLTKNWLAEQLIGLSVKLYGGATGDGSTNDTTAIQNTIDRVNALGGGVVYIDPGTFICNVLTLYANIELRGFGDASILKQPTGVADGNHLLNVNAGTGGTADPAANTKNITIRDISLVGRADVDTFTEQVHLVNLNAASDVTFDNVKFINWRGDAIYLGSGNSGTIERHNESILIRGCTFDGTTSLRNNRNAISIIDGTDIKIVHNEFRNHTINNMPGAIDLEPNPSTASFARIRNVEISHNTFTNVGGNAGVITVYGQYAQSTMTYPVNDVRITDNTFRDCDNLVQIWVYNPEQATATLEPHDIYVADNDFSVGGKISNATITVASPGVVTTPINHDLQVNDQVYFGTTGALPTGLAADTAYWVVATPTATTFRVSATRGGAAINTSGTQSGTHTVYHARQLTGLEFDGIRGTRVANNKIKGFSNTPIAVGYTYNTYNIQFQQNHFIENGSINGRLIYLYRAQYAYFINNIIDNSIYLEVFRFDVDGTGGSTDHIYALHNNIIGSLGGGLFSSLGGAHSTSKATNLALDNDSPVTIPVAHWSNANGWRTQTKQADQAVINSATLIDDTELQFPMLANRTYRIRGKIFWDTTANGDYKYTFVGPASPTLVRGEITAGIAGSTPAFSAILTAYPSSTGVSLAGTGTTGGYIFIDMIVKNGANAGTFKLQFAQGTASNDTGAINRAGSYLEWSII